VLFVVRLRRLLSVTPPMDCVRPRHMGMVRRFLVLPALVVFCCFTMVASSVSKMFLCCDVRQLFSTLQFLPGYCQKVRLTIFRRSDSPAKNQTAM
jgi:hypothetical protein